MQMSLFDRLGGETLLEPAVRIFYDKVLADPQLAPFFETVDMSEQLGKQKKFLSFAFGGSNKYSGSSLRAVHAPLVKNGLNVTHFLAVAVHLHSTLEELNVPSALIDEVLKIVAATQDDVLGINT